MKVRLCADLTLPSTTNPKSPVSFLEALCVRGKCKKRFFFCNFATVFPLRFFINVQIKNEHKNSWMEKQFMVCPHLPEQVGSMDYWTVSFLQNNLTVSCIVFLVIIFIVFLCILCILSLYICNPYSVEHCWVFEMSFDSLTKRNVSSIVLCWTLANIIKPWQSHQNWVLMCNLSLWIKWDIKNCFVLM